MKEIRLFCNLVYTLCVGGLNQTLVEPKCNAQSRNWQEAVGVIHKEEEMIDSLHVRYQSFLSFLSHVYSKKN